MIKIAVVEDILGLRKAMENKLSMNPDFKLKYIAQHGQEIIDFLNSDHNVDIILMDIQMPVMNGIEATREINSRWPHIKIIMCTIFDDDDNIFNAILAGASGYLMKDEQPEMLFRAIFECLEGGAPMSPIIAKKALALIRNSNQSLSPNREDFGLTKREIEILEHLSKGLSYKVIADNLFISTGTVRKHIENIYKKLQVNNKIEAITIAEKNRVI